MLVWDLAWQHVFHWLQQSCCLAGKKDLDLLQTLEDYWGRYESDDIYYMLITLINKFVTRVPELQSMQVSQRFTVCQCSIAC